MEYKKINLIVESNSELGKWVRKLERSAVYEILFGFAIFSLFAFKMYENSDGNLSWFIIAVLGLSFYLALYIRWYNKAC